MNCNKQTTGLDASIGITLSAELCNFHKYKITNGIMSSNEWHALLICLNLKGRSDYTLVQKFFKRKLN